MDTRHWYTGLLLVWAVAIFLHFDAINHSFVFDDFPAIVENNVITDSFNLKKIFATGFWGETDNFIQSSWRPFTVLTFVMNHAVGGNNPFGYHLVNLCLHGAVTVLVALLAFRFGVSRRAALLAAGLFSVHPLHVDCIVPAVGRADLLMAVAGIAGILLWDARKTVLSMVCLVLALLSKEMGVIVAAIMIWQDWIEGGRFKRPSGFRWVVPIFLVAVWGTARYLLFGKLVETQIGILENPLVAANWSTKLWTTGELYLKSLGLVVFPKVLLREYAFAEIVPSISPTVKSILGLLALSATIVATIWTSRRQPKLSVALGLWTLGYLLVSHLGPTLPMIFAERVFYLPTAGLFVSLFIVLERLSFRKRIQNAIYVTLLASCALLGYRSLIRVGDWQNSIKLNIASLRDGPNSVKNIVSAVDVLNSNGLMSNTKALKLLDRANQISNDHPFTLRALAKYYIAFDNGKKAKEYLDKAEDAVTKKEKLLTLQCAYASKYDHVSSLSICEKAVAYKPNDSYVWMYYAIALDWAGDFDLAESAFKRAIEKMQYPNANTFINFGSFLGNHGRLQAAEKMFEAALQINPDNAEAAEYLAQARREMKR